MTADPRQILADVLEDGNWSRDSDDLAAGLLAALRAAGLVIVPSAEHERLLEIAGTRAPRQPSLAQIKAYMRATGWLEEPPGVRRSFWVHTATGRPVAVPHEDGDDLANGGVVTRVAAAENRKAYQVIQNMLAQKEQA